MRKKLANGGKEAMLRGAQERYMASLNNVATPAGIRPARSNAVRLVDLAETVKETITNGNGVVVVAAGTKINPLVISPLTKKLFFIDARDQRQLLLVKKLAEPEDKIILLGGSVFKAGEFLKRRVYLDVPGFHTRIEDQEPSIHRLPRGRQLKVQEVAQWGRF